MHEFGHVLHAWISGGTVTKVVLHPLAISRTDVRPNPAPRFVVWGGFVWGVALPGVISLVAASRNWRWQPFFAFLAGFCLLANGAYLALGFWSPVGDTRMLVRHGEFPALLLVLGVALTTAGLWQWHRLDRNAGRDWTRRLTRRDIAGVTIALASVIIAEWLLSSRI